MVLSAIFGVLENGYSMLDALRPLLLTILMNLVALAAAHAGQPPIQLPADTTWLAQPTAENARPPTGNQLDAPPAGTVVGIGDSLLITVFGHPDMSAEVVVSEDNQVAIPLIGRLRVSGMTQEALERLIAQKLREGEYLQHPEVSVTLRQISSRRVAILGEVAKPGRYPLRGKVSVLDLVAEAGGLTPGADHVVYLIRQREGAENQAVRTPIDLRELNERAFHQANQMLMPNDVLYVGPQRRFYIHGEVRKPGSYPVEPNLDVMRALSVAGGVTERGSTSRIRLYRKNEQQQLQERAAALDEPVSGDDVIFVKERFF